MHIVEHHPVPLSMGHLQIAHGDNILSLTHAHIVVCVAWNKAVLVRQIVEVSHDIGSWGEDEVDGHCGCAVCKAIVKDSHTAQCTVTVCICIPIGQHYPNEVKERSRYPIGPQAPHH